MRLSSKNWGLGVVVGLAMATGTAALAEPKLREITDFPAIKPAEGTTLTNGIPHGRADHVA